MLFGTNKVSPRIHTLSTLIVAVGTSISAFWIIALNSWMHTPAGFEMRGGKAFATDWLAVLFNPSMPYRYTHMMIASGLTVAFLVAGISAYRWKRGDQVESVRLGLKTGLYLAALLIPIQILVGDMHGLNTREHQPAKIAAMEGVWKTGKDVPLLLFALPDAEGKSNRFSLGVPGLSSFIITHDWHGEIRGLNEFEGMHPPVAPVFWGFRIMVGTGLLMLAVSWFGAWRMRKHREPGALLLRVLPSLSFLGWVAVVAGWYTTEIGRQPYLVYGVLKTADAVAKSVTAPMVASTLVMYLLLYVGLIVAYVFVVFYLARQADHAKGKKLPEQGFSSAAVAEKAGDA